jgi:FOG: EAL domain
LSIETNLRLALERKEFFLHYQVKLDFKTNTINGVEALLRWQNPYLGSVTPTQFIPVAEESGLIIPIYSNVGLNPSGFCFISFGCVKYRSTMLLYVKTIRLQNIVGVAG